MADATDSAIREEVLAADAVVSVDLSCYPLEVVHRTCYAFTDRAYVWIEGISPLTVRVAILGKTPNAAATALAGEFRNALVDFALRRTLAAETKTIRESLIQTALRAGSKSD